MIAITRTPKGCPLPGWGVGLSALVAVALLFTGTTTALGQTLNGVTCADVVTNGVAADDPSDRGFTNPFIGSPIALPGLSGFDYLTASAWVRNDGQSDCDKLLNELYVCLSVAGRWGDADGDGVRDAQGGVCGTPINPGSDGPIGELPLSRNESLTFFVDRDCDGVPDLQLELSGMVGGSPSLVVIADDFTGKAGTDLGDEGVAFDYSDKDNTAYTTCPAEVTTEVLLYIADWDSYFDFAGPPDISPAIFNYDINGGNRVDGPPEDNVRGSVDVSAPDFTITKDPDLALCEGQQGNLTITVTNTGNVKISNMVVTDELPVGWTSCGVVSGGVTVQQVGTTLTFSSFDLEPCEVKEIVFCIEAGAECTDGQNLASAEGAFLAACIDGGGRGVGPKTASSLLECLVGPCINIRCEATPLEVCPDDQYTVTVWGTNCSSAIEDITLWIDGESKFFEDVAAGAEVTFDWVFTAPSVCDPGSQITHTTRAVATNECNPSPGVEKTCPVAVTCGPKPCVEAFCEVLDTQLIPGESTIIRGSAKNCGNGPADITIFILGPDDLGQVYCQETFLDVAAGATVDHECDWDCTPQTSGIHNFRVRAVATNDCGEATDQSDGECAVNCEEPGLCWMTSGGNHSGQDSKGQKLWTWGGNVGPPPHGSWQHTERDGEGTILFNFHSHDVEVFSCYHDGGDGPCHPNAEDNVILYGGTGEYNLGKGKKIYQAQWEARAEDHGEPGNTPNRDGGCGSPDFYYIKVWNSDTQEVIFEHGEYVEGGNIQIHPLKENQMRRIDDAAGRTDLRSNSDLGLGDEMQLGQLALYTPTPNPFNHTTRVAYAVKGGTSERVDIGIYNVAGQLVRKLVSGMESPGYHEVTWDARSEAGVQVSPGVYFLRAFVGAERIKGTRILYMR